MSVLMRKQVRATSANEPAWDRQSPWWLPQLTGGVPAGFEMQWGREDPNRSPRLHPRLTVCLPRDCWVPGHQDETAMQIIFVDTLKVLLGVSAEAFTSPFYPQVEDITYGESIYLSFQQLESRKVQPAGHWFGPIDGQDVPVVACQRPPHPDKKRDSVTQGENRLGWSSSFSFNIFWRTWRKWKKTEGERRRRRKSIDRLPQKPPSSACPSAVDPDRQGREPDINLLPSYD